jgi:GNAT superfamily N-acetyltransferase
VRAEPQVRQSERDARQGRRADVAETNGGGIDVRELTDPEVARIGDRLPLHRLESAQTYLVAWDGSEPVGHAHIAWKETALGVPEIGDVFVPAELRGRGIGTQLSEVAEQMARMRGHHQISISASIANEGALRLYLRLGYRDAGLPPKRVQGTIIVRAGAMEVDDTLLYLIKDLAGA